MKIKQSLTFACISFIIFFVIANIYAGSTGKIMGFIKDKESGEPLVGANVYIDGKNLGAATDEDGLYIILQVPPGNYNIIANYMGYHELMIKEVQVRPNLTSRANFELQSNIIEAPTIEVVADKPMVLHDVTATRRYYSSEEMAVTPGVQNVSDIMSMQSGFFVDAVPEVIAFEEGYEIEVRDPSLKSINVRGSRGGDAIYLIDGVPAVDPVSGGYDILNLNVEDIEHIEIITGAFSAEYGQTQAAVINITTKSGGAKLGGSANYRMDIGGVWGASYGNSRTSVTLQGPEPITQMIVDIVGLPGKTAFYATGTLDLTNTPYNNNRTRETLYVLPFTDPEKTLLKERQDNTLNLNLRLDYQINNQLKTMFSYRSLKKRWTRFDWLWKDFPDHSEKYERDTQQLQFRINHTLSNTTFYDLNLSYTSVDYNKSNAGREPSDFWVITDDTLYSTVQPPRTDPLTLFYDQNSYHTDWVQNNNQVYRLSFNITSQVNSAHLLKAGFEAERKDLSNVSIFAGGSALSAYGRYIFENGDFRDPPPGPYKEFGTARTLVSGNPMMGGVYITDKLELASLIINAGIRGDWFMPSHPTTSEVWKESWEQATGLKADWPTIHYQIDPRFGISFPVSVKTVLYFSYGHFNKLPQMDYYITDPYSGSGQNFTGSPHLDYVKTVKYEFGFTHQFAPSWAIDVKNFVKETSGEIGQTRIKAQYGLPLYLYDNNGYSRARGLEFELRKQQSNYFGGRLTYTLLWSSGYSSSAFDDYKRSLTNLPNPIRENRLNWDLRHQIVLRANISVLKNQHPNLFGLKLPDDWNISLLTHIQSGEPYTPGTHNLVEEQKLTNIESGPWHSRTDLKIAKNFVFGGIRLKMGIDISNIFDQFNVYVRRGFNVWAGEPFTYGHVIEDSNEYWKFRQMFKLLKPDRFKEGRHLEFVVQIAW